MKRIVLIPAFQPDEKMVVTAADLYAAGFAVVIVNDGSPAACDGVIMTHRISL